MIDVEKLVAKYLRDTVGVRVVGKTPDSIAESWVRLTEIDAPQMDGSMADHLVPSYLQLDCYAGEEGGQPEAKALALQCRAALGLPITRHDHGELGVVTASRIEGQSRVPDASIEPARDRVILTVTVRAHG